ncbi:MAG: PAS domain-containing protein, partial [Draconibacterium sp.]|nr:PAS domain-containing protein [Draconibacterium sp.]
MNKNKGIQQIVYSEVFSELLSQIELLTFDNYEETVTQSLKKIQKILDVSNIYIVKKDNILKSKTIYTTDDRVVNIDEKYQNIKNAFSFFTQQLNDGKIINISHIDELPDEANFEKKVLKENGIVSLIIIPYNSSKRCSFTFICTSNKQTSWPIELVLELNLFFKFLCFQIDRIIIVEELEKSEIKFRVMAENSYDFELWAYPNGRHLYISPSCKRMTGYDSEEVYSEAIAFYDIIHPDDLLALKKALEPG